MLETQETQVQCLGQEDPLEEETATTPVFLPEESHGQGSLAGYGPRGHQESDRAEWRTYMHTSLVICIWQARRGKTDGIQMETEQGPVGLPGMEAFLPPISCRQDFSLHDLPWVPKGRSERLSIKRRTAKKPPVARLEGPEKHIKIWRPTTWDGGSSLGFPCGSAGKESACNVGDLGLIPELGRSLGKGKATHSSVLA